MTAHAIADAIRASLEAALLQLPAGMTVAQAIGSGAVRAAANNAATAVTSADPIALIAAAMMSLDGARSLTVRQPGERVDIEIGCTGDAACRGLAAQLGAPAPQTVSVGGMSWTWVTIYRDDGPAVTISAHAGYARQERAA